MNDGIEKPRTAICPSCKKEIDGFRSSVSIGITWKTGAGATITEISRTDECQIDDPICSECGAELSLDMMHYLEGTSNEIPTS